MEYSTCAHMHKKYVCSSYNYSLPCLVFSSGGRKTERQACPLFEDFFFFFWYGKEVTQSKNVLASPVTCEISQKSDKSAKELIAGNKLQNNEAFSLLL